MLDASLSARIAAAATSMNAEITWRVRSPDGVTTVVACLLMFPAGDRVARPGSPRDYLRLPMGTKSNHHERSGKLSVKRSPQAFAWAGRHG